MGGLPGRGNSKAQVGQSAGDGGTEGGARAEHEHTRWVMRQRQAWARSCRPGWPRLGGGGEGWQENMTGVRG